MFDKKTKNKTIYEYAYIGNPNRKYNFPLNEMLMSDEMDFYKFMSNGKKYDTNGAFLVITEQQYVIGINAWDGAGSHNYSHARVNIALKNRHPETLSLQQISEEALELEENYIVIDFEDETSETNQSIKDMRVSLPRNKITQFEFQTFLNFYEDYSEAIKEGNFPVNCKIKNDNGTYEWIFLRNIDELLIFLKNNIDENIYIHKIENETLINEHINYKKKTM